MGSPGACWEEENEEGFAEDSFEMRQVIWSDQASSGDKSRLQAQPEQEGGSSGWDGGFIPSFVHHLVLHEAVCFPGELCSIPKPLEMNTHPKNLLLFIISWSLFRV